MLKFYNYDIVFQEIPDEVTLAVNITGCPFRCSGCHSPHLREDIGTPLTGQTLDSLVQLYGTGITCVCFMGGDSNPEEVDRLASYVKTHYSLLTGWYSGREHIPKEICTANFDYIKLGPYMAQFGGLKHPNSNQHLYMVEKNGVLTDITTKFAAKSVGTR
ncbi:MAG: anaerobic ribonucleoside-triphosphate reductase activating protein [Bacteroidales bacterium]|nr:anaerobic ribonucleoside-triphosphate reductase activating protein [Bacteroidales bacterium]MDD4670565.1 anaerobic ribonucleoside-triphosphate reductase activating protein [Bacteroidales bacterium]